MAKEYARKQPKNSGGGLKSLFIFLVAFLCGYGSASIDFSPISQLIHTQLAQTSTKPIPKQMTPKTTLPKPKFEFYTLLTSESVNQSSIHPAKPTHSVPPPAEPTKNQNTVLTKNIMPAPPPPPSQTITAAVNAAVSSQPNKDVYLVQVGSFKNKQEAEKIKASLTLKGYGVTMSTISQASGNWYRVVVGPFTSRGQAEKAQSAVARSEHVTGMIRKMDA